MRVAHERGDIALHGEVKTGEFSIRNTSKLNYVLSDMYQDRLRAWIRELVTNAIDANREVGATRPPELTAPNILRPWASIRDYGPGLDRQRMSIFTELLASSKDLDDQQNGGWGLGCKSPFAYTDTFHVTTWPGDGYRYEYMLHKQTSGAFAYSTVAQMASNAPRGTEVKVAVAVGDIDRANMWLEVYASYARMPIRLLGGLEDRTLEEWPEHTKRLDAGDATMLLLPQASARKVKTLYAGEGVAAGLVLVAGDVPYLVSKQGLIPSGHPLHNLVQNIPAILYAPVGSFTIPPSRDVLRNTEENRQRLEAMLNSLRVQLQQTIMSTLDHRSAWTLLASADLALSSYMPSTQQLRTQASPGMGVSLTLDRGRKAISYRAILPEMATVLHYQRLEGRQTTYGPPSNRARGYGHYHGCNIAKAGEVWEVTAHLGSSASPDIKAPNPLVVLDDMGKGAKATIEDADPLRLDTGSSLPPGIIWLVQHHLGSPHTLKELSREKWAMALNTLPERVILASQMVRRARGGSGSGAKAIGTKAARDGVLASWLEVHEWRKGSRHHVAKVNAHETTLRPGQQGDYANKSPWYIRAKRRTAPIGFQGTREDLTNLILSLGMRQVTEPVLQAGDYSRLLLYVSSDEDQAALDAIGKKDITPLLISTTIEKVQRLTPAAWQAMAFTQEITKARPAPGPATISALCAADKEVAANYAVRTQVLAQYEDAEHMDLGLVARLTGAATTLAPEITGWQIGLRTAQRTILNWPLFFQEEIHLGERIYLAMLKEQTRLLRLAGYPPAGRQWAQGTKEQDS